MMILDGRNLDLDDPDPRLIRYANIAHSLAGRERFNSQLREPWVVGEHTACAAMLALRDMIDKGESFAEGRIVVRFTHHHDDGEAFYGDVIRPIAKYLGPAFHAMRRRVDGAINTALSLIPDERHHFYDHLMLEAEFRRFAPNGDRDFGEAVNTSKLLSLAERYIQRVLDVKDGARRRVAKERLMEMEDVLLRAPVSTLLQLEGHMERAFG